MYDFIKSVKEKSRRTEAHFIIGLDEENANYTKKLLQSVYDLKKYSRKLNTKINSHSKYNLDNSEIIKLRDIYFNTASLFSLRFNYVHMIFTIMVTVAVTYKFDEDVHSYGKLTNDKRFKEIFDTTEQELLIKFNQLRNIVVHTPFAEMFLDFDNQDFVQLQNLVNGLIELEKVIMYELRRNSFFSPHSHND